MNLCKKLLGNRIKELRKSRGMTQENLSEYLGCEPNHVAKIEAGTHFPQPEKLDILTKVFEISMKDLFDYEHKLSEHILKDNISNWLTNASISDLEFIYKTINNLKELKR